MDCCVGTQEVHHGPLGAAAVGLEGLPEQGFVCDLLEGQDPEAGLPGEPSHLVADSGSMGRSCYSDSGLTVSKGLFSPAGPFCLLQGLGN